jgi:regulator of extracellular matrix RemA (YlzA/DUF370 family)
MYLTCPIFLHQIITVQGCHLTNGTLVKGSATGPTGSMVTQVNHDMVLSPSTSPRTNRLINECKTQRQVADTTYDMDDDSTVIADSISTSAIHGEISASQDEVSAERKKKVKTKMMDINESQYNMGHKGEVALRRYLNHHNIETTDKFQNCISCMKWKAQTSKLTKLQRTQPSTQESVCI